MDIRHVIDNIAKLTLAGIRTGDRVLVGEERRLETYTGPQLQPGPGTVPRLWIGDRAGDDLGGWYQPAGTIADRRRFLHANDSQVRWSTSDKHWEVVNGASVVVWYAAEDIANPWDVSQWISVTPGKAMIVVAREDRVTDPEDWVTTIEGLPPATQQEAEAGTETELRSFSPLINDIASRGFMSRIRIRDYLAGLSADTMPVTTTGVGTFTRGPFSVRLRNWGQGGSGTVRAGFFSRLIDGSTFTNTSNLRIDFGRPSIYHVNIRHNSADGEGYGMVTWGKEPSSFSEHAPVGALTSLGLGLRWEWNDNDRQLYFVSHNGTLDQQIGVTSMLNYVGYNIAIYNRGDGTGLLFLDGVQALTLSDLPVSETDFDVIAQAEIDMVEQDGWVSTFINNWGHRIFI